METVSYHKVSRCLHWTMAAAIFCMLALGWGRGIVPSEWKSTVMDIHKSLGIIVLILAAVRLSWRLYCPPPPLPDSLTALEKKGSAAVHHLLYALFFVMPLTGWYLVSAAGRSVDFLGLIQLPALTAENPVLGKQLDEVHETLALVLAGLVLFHIAAALYHHFIKKDAVLRRMWPLPQKKNLP